MRGGDDARNQTRTTHLMQQFEPPTGMRFTNLHFLPILLSLATAAFAGDLESFTPRIKKGNGVLKLNDNLYEQLTSGTRNYGAVILMTAMGSEVACMPCKQHDPEFRMLAAQYLKKHGNFKSDGKDLIFASLDYRDGQTTYAKLGLNVAPTLTFWPATTIGLGDSSKIDYSFDRSGFQADALAHFISNVRGEIVQFSRPIDCSKVAAPAITLLAVLVALFLASDYVLLVIQSRILWALATIGLVLTMTGGYMWNQIRTPQWLQVGQHGEKSYFAGGYSNQYGVETPLVASLYGTLGLCVLMLCQVSPRIQNPLRQRISIYMWSGILFTLFGILMSVFRAKQGAYPFKLIF